MEAHMFNADPDFALQKLREELDGVDRRLLEIIRFRLDCCARIGHHKKLHGVPMLQPHRIDIVQRRAEEFASVHGLSAEFLRALYECIIEETCRLEDEIIGTPPRAG